MIDVAGASVVVRERRGRENRSMEHAQYLEQRRERVDKSGRRPATYRSARGEAPL